MVGNVRVRGITRKMMLIASAIMLQAIYFNMMLPNTCLFIQGAYRLPAPEMELGYTYTYI